MKNSNIYIVGIAITVVYLLTLGGLTYYEVIPSPEEKQAVQVTATPVDSAPVDDELAAELSAREKYGDWPLEIQEERVGKYNPFRL